MIISSSNVRSNSLRIASPSEGLSEITPSRDEAHKAEGCTFAGNVARKEKGAKDLWEDLVAAIIELCHFHAEHTLSPTKTIQNTNIFLFECLDKSVGANGGGICE